MKPAGSAPFWPDLGGLRGCGGCVRGPTTLAHNVFDLGMKSTDAFLREYADAEGPFFLRDFAMAEEECF